MRSLSLAARVCQLGAPWSSRLRNLIFPVLNAVMSEMSRTQELVFVLSI